MSGFAAALLALALAAPGAAAAAPPLIVLDPGHTPAQPGATSHLGTPEVAYNDRFVALLRPRLAAAGFAVEVTRGPGEEVPLDARVPWVNARRPFLLLSIHHDSAQERYLAPVQRGAGTAPRTTRPIRGFSLFASGRNPRLDASLQAARAIGRALVALGRPPALHHAEPIPGEGRPLLDPALGVYRFDDLRLLRKVECPAVLLEVGVIVDPEDEAWVADPGHQAAMADAIVAALRGLVPAR